MAIKTYTLELTAEEVRRIDETGRLYCSALTEKFSELVKQAARDREADELRLPWKAVGDYRSWCVQRNGCDPFLSHSSGAAAKLMSAAPELLEAVKEAERCINLGNGYFPQLRRLIDRALRKVETGVPE